MQLKEYQNETHKKHAICTRVAKDKAMVYPRELAIIYPTLGLRSR